MSSPSCDRTELQELRDLLHRIAERVTSLERHAGLKVESSEPSVATKAETLAAVQPAERVSGDASPSDVVEAEIIFSDLRQSVASGQGPESSLTSQVALPSRPRSGESLESMIGGRLFTWMGGVLLILATAFFVVWSWRNLDFPDWSRVAMMHSVGLGAIIVGGWFRNRSLEVHSRVLYGVGIFALYASALAMTHMYRLGGEFHELFGFIDGTLITLLAIFLSLRSRSVGVVLLGALGGYLTPILTIHGNGDPVIMFGYLALLNVALVVSSYFGKWDFLKPVAWFATVAIFFHSIFTGFFETTNQGLWLLSIHGVIFLMASALPHLLWRSRSSNSGNVILAFNALGYLLAYLAITRQTGQHLANINYLLMVIHAVVTCLAFVRLGTADRLGRVSLALSTLFLTAGLTFQFRDQPHLWTSIWALEGFAFGLIGFAWRDRQMLVTSAIAFGMTILRALVNDLDPFWQASTESGILDPRTINWLFYAALLGVAGSSFWWKIRIGVVDSTMDEATDHKREIHFRTWAGGFLMVANLVFLVALAFQFREESNWILLCVALDCGLLWLFGFQRAAVRQYASLLAIGVVLFGVPLLAVSFENLHDYWGYVYRVTFILVPAILISAGFAYWIQRKRIELSGEKAAHTVFTTAGHLALLGVLTAEIILFFDSSSPGSNGEMATWSVAWGIYAAILVMIGFSMRYPLYRFLGIGLFSVVLAKIFLVDLSQFELIVRVVALLSIGLLMLGVSLLYQKFRTRIESA